MDELFTSTLFEQYTVASCRHHQDNPKRQKARWVMTSVNNPMAAFLRLDQGGIGRGEETSDCSALTTCDGDEVPLEREETESEWPEGENSLNSLNSLNSQKERTCFFPLRLSLLPLAKHRERMTFALASRILDL